MLVVLRHPVEVLARGLQPAAVFAQSVLAAHDVMVRHHSRRQRFVEPHLLFLLPLGDVAPAGRAGGPSCSHVGGHLPLLNGVADPALQRAAPEGGGISTTALVVALEPFANLAELYQIGPGADAAAQVGKEEVGRLLLFGDGIVKLPEIDDALVEFLPSFDRAGLRQFPALVALARRHASRRPGVGEHAVHIVKRVDFTHDGRHVIGHVGGVRAGAEEPALLRELAGIALCVALEPLGMRFEGILPVQVRTHARNYVNAAFLCGCAALAEEIAAPEKLAFPVERHFRLVEGQDPGNADHYGVHFQAGPVIRPLLHIERNGVMFGHIELAHAPDFALPRNFDIRGQ